MIILLIPAFLINTYSSVNALEQVTTKKDTNITLSQENTAVPGMYPNLRQLSNFTYHSSISVDSRFRWRVKEIERDEDVHMAEGDKRIKIRDNIELQIQSRPDLIPGNPENWGQVYVNDVAAGYQSTSDKIRGVLKYVLPIEVNMTSLFKGEYTPADLDDPQYITGDGIVPFAVFLEFCQNHEDIEGYDYWVFTQIENGLLIYDYSGGSVSSGKIIDATLTFDMKTGLLNEMTYKADLYDEEESLIGSGYMELIRLHGFGLPYTMSTLVVWVPIIVVILSIIIVFRLNLIQKLKLRLEARKLAKRE